MLMRTKTARQKVPCDCDLQDGLRRRSAGVKSSLLRNSSLGRQKRHKSLFVLRYCTLLVTAKRVYGCSSLQKYVNGKLAFNEIIPPCPECWTLYKFLQFVKSWKKNSLSYLRNRRIGLHFCARRQNWIVSFSKLYSTSKHRVNWLPFSSWHTYEKSLRKRNILSLGSMNLPK